MPLDNLTPQQAAALLERYPAFTYAALRLMRTTPDPAVRHKMRQRLAACTGSIPDLRELLGADSESLAGFYPDTLTPHPTTDAAIEQFIDRFGSQDAPLQYVPGEQSPELPPQLPPQPAQLPSEQSAEPPAVPSDGRISPSAPADDTPAKTDDPTSSAIDAFLAAVPPPPLTPNLRDTASTSAPLTTSRTSPRTSPAQAATQSDGEEETPRTEKKAEEAALTESFARILIKNGNYRKALEIMTELNLKNSKKNIYFADQIRFLKKLIVIAKQ